MQLRSLDGTYLWWLMGWVWALSLAGSPEAMAQIQVKEDMLMNTSWRYRQTIHAATGESIHEASDDYQYFLHLKFDYTYENYLNGKKVKGTWLLNGGSNELYYDFRNIKWWRIDKITESELTLAFELGEEEYYYTYERVEYEETPFQKPLNELPTVRVNRKRRGWWPFGRRNRKPKTFVAKSEEQLVPIEIQMAGGGFYGGIDPVVKNYIHIKPNGRCIKEVESLQNGLTKQTFDIPRENLVKFAEFVSSKAFFDMDRSYDCVSSECIRRKRIKPTPIPLRLSVRYGDQYHIVVISIYGYDDETNGRKLVKYPPEIDAIVEGVHKLIEQM